MSRLQRCADHFNACERALGIGDAACVTAYKRCVGPKRLRRCRDKLRQCVQKKRLAKCKAEHRRCIDK